MFHFPGGGHPFHKGPAPHRHRRVSAWHSKGTARAQQGRSKGTARAQQGHCVAVRCSSGLDAPEDLDKCRLVPLACFGERSVEISRHGLTGGDSSAVLCKLKNEGHWNELQRSILFFSSSWFYLTKIWLGPNTETLQQSAMCLQSWESIEALPGINPSIQAWFAWIHPYMLILKL